MSGVWFFAGCFLLLFISVFRPFSPKNSHWFSTYISPVVIRIFGLNIVIRNREQLLKSHPCIYTPNHQSILDVFVIGHIFPENSISVGKKSLKWVPFFGWAYWLSGHLLIDRGDNAKAVATMGKALARMKRETLSVVVAPEGTRSTQLRDFKKGAFYLAIDSQLPLQPVAVSSYEKFLNYNRLKTGTILMKVLDPISVKGKTRADVDDLMKLTHSRMKAAIAELDAELASSAGFDDKLLGRG